MWLGANNRSLIDGLRTYTTAFPLTQNPLSESGAWIAPPASWTPLATDGDVAYNTQITPWSSYDDSMAMASGLWKANHEVEIVLSFPNALGSVGAGSHEIEALLRVNWDNGANTILQYECQLGCTSAGVYSDILKLDGVIGTFHSLTPNIINGVSAYATGDRYRARITGNNIETFYRPISTGVELPFQQVTVAGGDIIATGRPAFATFWRGSGTSKDLAATAVTVREF